MNHAVRIRQSVTPRFAVWRALTGGADASTCQAWLDERWKEYEAEHGLEGGRWTTFVHQEPFDRWLVEYARRREVEIAPPRLSVAG